MVWVSTSTFRKSCVVARKTGATVPLFESSSGAKKCLQGTRQSRRAVRSITRGTLRSRSVGRAGSLKGLARLALRTEGCDDTTVVRLVKESPSRLHTPGPGRASALAITRRALNQLFCVRYVNPQNRRHALPVFLVLAEASAIAPEQSSLSLLFFARPSTCPPAGARPYSGPEQGSPAAQRRARSVQMECVSRLNGTRIASTASPKNSRMRSAITVAVSTSHSQGTRTSQPTSVSRVWCSASRAALRSSFECQ